MTDIIQATAVRVIRTTVRRRRITARDLPCMVVTAVMAVMADPVAVMAAEKR